MSKQQGGAGRAASNIAQSDLGFGAGEALRVEDVMRILHLSRNTVYKLAREGELPSYRVGRQMRFRYDDVRARLESSVAEKPAPAPAEAVSPDVLSQATGTPLASGTPLSPGTPLVSGTPGATPLTCADPAEPLPAWAKGSLVVGGQDMVADVLCNYLGGLGIGALRAHTSAYLSLARMYLGTCHATTLELWSERDRAFNAPYLRTLLPGVSAVAFRLYGHQVGFTVAKGNPRGLYDWVDLLKPGVVLANRESGSGPRVLLDEKLKRLEARAATLAGYDKPVGSELAQALLVARGLADVALTSAKPAGQVKGLEFVPLMDAVADFAVLKTPQTAAFVKATQSLLRTEAFRSEFDAQLYDVRHMGEVVYEC